MPDWSYVHTELRHKSVTLELLWIEYREHPDDGGYSQFCNRYVAWRRNVDVVMRQRHRAGEKMFVDFSGASDPDLRRRERARWRSQAELFVACLGASSYLYAEALRSQGLLALGDRQRPCPRVLRGRPADLRATTSARG